MHNRLDEETYQFTTLSLMSMKYKLYHEELDPSLSAMTYKHLCSGGNCVQTQRRNMVMYQSGGTIGPSRYPTFLLRHETKGRHILPRPVVKIRPGQIGYNMMKQCKWLRELCRDIKILTIKDLNHQKSQTSENLLQHIYFCKKHKPFCFHNCDTFFTHMIMVGSLTVMKDLIHFI